jgi:hypothetical protein
MQSSKLARTFLLLVLIQCTFVESGGWRWRRHRNRILLLKLAANILAPATKFQARYLLSQLTH